MKFKIDSKIFEKFPELNIGLVIAKNIDNKGINNKIIELIRNKERDIINNFSKDILSENLKLNSWRKAYSSFGAKKYRCSVENLYRMILDDVELKHINKIVDIYNYISIKHVIPVGGDDLDKIDGDLELTFAKGNEKFVQLNSSEIDHPKKEEVIYKDDKEVTCRRWNWRECDKSKMTEATKNVILVVEGLPPFIKDDIKDILDEMSLLVKDVCCGEIKKIVLDRELREIKI